MKLKKQNQRKRKMKRQLKIPRPNTAGRRKISFENSSVLTKEEPEKSLLVSIKKHAGRDRRGRISVRHRGGGAKRLYRKISDLGEELDQKAKVLALEYDPNRSAHIGLVEFEDKTKAYILAPQGLKVGDTLIAQEKAPLKIGNRLQLRHIPVGTEIYDIELYPQARTRLARSAGAFGQLFAREEKDYVQIKLPSGEIRKVLGKCFASIGRVSNPEHQLVRIGQAGRKRHLGRRPTVRGKAMHPAAHPHGGGEGVSPIGLKHPKTPWGKIARGKRTRRNPRTDKFIVKRRK